MVCVESGLGLDAALRKVTDEMKGHAKMICEEFALANLQLQMGRPRREVLHDLGVRTGVDDVRSLAAILIQADRFGSSIAQALRVQSDSMRTRRRQLAEEKAAKTAVQLIFPLVLFIFPAIFVVLVGPAAIQIQKNLLKVVDHTRQGRTPCQVSRRRAMNRFFRAAMVAAIFPLGLASVGCMHKSGFAANCGNGNGNGSGGCGDRYRELGRYFLARTVQLRGPSGGGCPVRPTGRDRPLHQPVAVELVLRTGNGKVDPGGMEKLDSLARATPNADPRLYIQTAHDVAVTAENMDKVAGLRNELNAKRAASIKRYMTTQFGPALDYEVFVHDAPVPGIYGPFVAGAFRGQGQGYQGGIDSGGGSGAPSVAGSTRRRPAQARMVAVSGAAA